MKKNYYLLALIFVVFFAISFLTNILGAINPNVSDSFSLSGVMTGMLPFSFFIAYALMSIPSGMMVQKFDEKKCLVFAWMLALTGAILFSLFPSFEVFLGSLFLIGCGMALLQVIAYPLLRVVGGEKHFAFNSVLAQLVFGAASFLSPFVYSYLVTHLGDSTQDKGPFISFIASLTPDSLSWVSIYWIFSFVSFLMIIIVLFSPIPKVVRNVDEMVGAWDTHVELFKQKNVILFFFGIFSYVGTEQGISNWISEFLRTYHGFKPEMEGSETVGLFWGMMTIGCIPGMALLKVMDSKTVLRMFTIAAMIILAFTLLGNANFALFGFPALGFCLSVMYAIIFSLALNSVSKFHGSFAGILCTGIAGGAIVSLLIGKLKDVMGLQSGMMILFIPLAYILSIGFWAKPIVQNATIGKEK
ncbi:MAG: MFS transporter [Bacteroidota bacterium]